MSKLLKYIQMRLWGVKVEVDDVLTY